MSRLQIVSLTLLILSPMGYANPKMHPETGASFRSGVVVSRIRNWYGALDFPPVLIDGQSVGRLSNRPPLLVQLAPGVHHIHIQQNILLARDGTDLTFEVKPGRITHIVAKPGRTQGQHLSPVGYGANSVAVYMPNTGWNMWVVR